MTSVFPFFVPRSLFRWRVAWHSRPCAGTGQPSARLTRGILGGLASIVSGQEPERMTHDCVCAHRPFMRVPFHVFWLETLPLVISRGLGPSL